MERDTNNLVLIGSIKIREQQVNLYLDQDIKDVFEDIQLLAKLMNYNVEQSIHRFMYEVNVKFNFNKNDETKFCIIFEYINHSYGCSFERIDTAIYNEDDNYMTIFDNKVYNKKEEIIYAIKYFKKLL